MFQFVFPDEADIVGAMGGAPWFFNNSFLTSKRWLAAMTMDQLQFQRSPTWLQICGLPLQFIATEVGKKIWPALGEILDVVVLTNRTKGGRFLRVLVSIGITTPLRCVAKVRDPFWVDFV